MMEAAARNCGLMIPQTPQLGGWLISTLFSIRVEELQELKTVSPGQHLELLVGDTLYFSANDGTVSTELWAHDTSNALNLAGG
jgi:hypothetical protein